MGRARLIFIERHASTLSDPPLLTYRDHHLMLLQLRHSPNLTLQSKKKAKRRVTATTVTSVDLPEKV